MGFGHIAAVSKVTASQDQSFFVRTVCDPGHVLFKQIRVSKNNVSLFFANWMLLCPLVAALAAVILLVEVLRIS